MGMRTKFITSFKPCVMPRSTVRNVILHISPAMHRISFKPGPSSETDGFIPIMPAMIFPIFFCIFGMAYKTWEYSGGPSQFTSQIYVIIWSIWYWHAMNCVL
ncbi:hypothetical protein F5051DRAFT_178583 [Lentinula edodes]|nr:hypothetical protein F5051DRAFT_178583 [Lentinula edodes]